MNKIKTVIVTDDRYVQHLGVTLTSLLENKKSELPIEFKIISNGLMPENEHKLTRLLLKYNTEFQFLTIDANQYKHLSVKNHMSHAAYYKISIPDLLSDCDKVLFLDCDLVIKEDVTELWRVELGETYLAAVENPCFDRYDQLNIPMGSKTFNSGVMVLNLKAWRTNRVSEDVLKYLHHHSHKTALHDQDGFNAVMYNKWLPLKPKWNQQTKFFEIKVSDTDFNPRDFEEALQKPAIIHYTTSSKPWQFANTHPFKQEYYKYLKMTEWSSYTPKDRNIKTIIKKIVIKLLPSELVISIRKMRLERKNKFVSKQ